MVELFKKHDKFNQLLDDDKIVRLVLESGDIELSQYILFDLIKKNKKKLRYFNKWINSAKSGREYEEKLKAWIVKILDKEIKTIDTVQNVTSIFLWIIKHSPIDQLCVAIILNKLPKESNAKQLFVTETECLSVSCENNLFEVLEKY